ncbi:MAG: MopE-related protein, partial [Bacteroidota bacterium]
FYTDLFLNYQAVRKIDPSLSNAVSHIHRNFRFGSSLFYHAESNELWGVVKPRITGPFARPFQLDLDTDEITYYPEIGDNLRYIIIPEYKMIYWIENFDKETLLRNNLNTGTIDTIHEIEANFRSYTSLLYNPMNDRVYFTTNTGDQRLFSMDAFGDDYRVENYPYELSELVTVNPADTTITTLRNFGDDQINRWNFMTGELVSFGENQEEFFKRSWNLTPGYYTNFDEDGDGFSILEDCDDSNANVNANAMEIPDNYVDENCDGMLDFTDEDGDGVPLNFDCNDQDSTINMYALEIPNNDVDENCDGIALIIDNDMDGYNSDEDCNDANANVNPGQEEIPNNGVDDNCDGVIDETTAILELSGVEIKVFPNPINQHLFIAIESNLEYQIQIHNSIGQKVYQNRNVDRINMSSLIPGTYVLSII